MLRHLAVVLVAVLALAQAHKGCRKPQRACRQWSSSSSSRCSPPPACINPPSASSTSSCKPCPCSSSDEPCAPVACPRRCLSSDSSLPSAGPDCPTRPCVCPLQPDCGCRRHAGRNFLAAPQQARNFEAPGHCACVPCACDPCAGRQPDECACENPRPQCHRGCRHGHH